MRGMTSCSAEDNAIYSASVVDKAIWVCNLDAQRRGQEAYQII
jgi:hypothetical protein